MIKKYFALSVIAASVALAGCSDDDDDDDGDNGGTPMPTIPAATPGEGNTAYDTIVNSTDHSTLLAAINSVDGLNDTLDNPASQFTIFAPTNAAFDALLAADPDDAFTETADFLAPANQATLVRILQYHVVSGTVSSTDLVALLGDGDDTNDTANTLLVDDGTAATLGFSANGDTIDVTDGLGNVVTLDLNTVDIGLAAMGETETGVVHSIDTVLSPPAAPAAPDPGTGTGGGGDPTPGNGTADTALAEAGNFTLFRAALANQQPAALDGNTWTIFVANDETLNAAGITEASGIPLVEHISSQGAFDEATLAGGFLPGGEIPIQSASNNPYSITSTAGSVTVNGFDVTPLVVGDGGSQVYTINGVLTAP